MPGLFLGCSKSLGLPRELCSMHNKLKRLIMISTIGLWSFRLSTRFCCPPQTLNSLALLSCSIILDHLRSLVGFNILYTSLS